MKEKETELTIRIERVSDLRRLLRMRARVLQSVFGRSVSSCLREMLYTNAAYFKRQVPEGNHIEFMAVADGDDIASGAICRQYEMPSPDNPTGICAYLMNIYVDPSWRRRGIASRIVMRLVEEALALGAGKIYLETTRKGRGVYRRLGFRPLKHYMKLK